MTKFTAEIKQVMFFRDILKILRTQIDPSELRSMNFTLISNLGISKKVDIAFVHTISELYLEREQQDYATRSREAYETHKRRKEDEMRGSPMPDLIESLDIINPRVYNPREPVLRLVLPNLLVDERYRDLRHDGYKLLEELATENLSTPTLARVYYQPGEVLHNLRNNFWDKNLFKNIGYQSQVIRLYCDIIMPQDIR